MEYYANHRWRDAALFSDIYGRIFLSYVDLVVRCSATGHGVRQIYQNPVLFEETEILLGETKEHRFKFYC